MGKILLFAILGLAIYLILWRGASLRKKAALNQSADAKAPAEPEAETLVYDEDKQAYVPKNKR